MKERKLSDRGLFYSENQKNGTRINVIFASMPLVNVKKNR